MKEEVKKGLLIVLGATVASVAFGIAHDLVTAHVYLPYFTVYHPKIVDSESPIVMALVWGFLATFWVGAPCGVILALANGTGPVPSLELSRVFRVLKRGTFWLFVSSILVLISLYAISSRVPMSARKASFENDRRAVVVATTHAYSYSAAPIACLIMSSRIIFLRLKKARDEAAGRE